MQEVRTTKIYDFVTMKDMQKTKEIGKFLVKIPKVQRNLFMREIVLWLLIPQVLQSSLINFRVHFNIGLFCFIFIVNQARVKRASYKCKLILALMNV